MPLNERVLFFKQCLQQFPHTGAITQSSRFLAKAIISHVQPDHHPVSILEVGGGTGAFTRHLVKLLRPGDRLVVYEINKHFADILRKRYGHHHNVEIINAAIEQIERKPTFDFIVAGLPLNNFPPEMVSDILAVLRDVAKPGATASFFEYAAIRSLKSPFVGKEERNRLRRVAEVIEDFLSRHHLRSHFVFLNVPPAYARHLKF
jgi:phosphatidylethanolamine/phosphatidyl-N-methylethanolamine N-methyltransferase